MNERSLFKYDRITPLDKKSNSYREEIKKQFISFQNKKVKIR